MPLNFMHSLNSFKQQAVLWQGGGEGSLVPRPPFAAFFAAVGKKSTFFHSCEKSCEGRPGYEAKGKDC